MRFFRGLCRGIEWELLSGLGFKVKIFFGLGFSVWSICMADFVVQLHAKLKHAPDSENQSHRIHRATSPASNAHDQEST